MARIYSPLGNIRGSLGNLTFSGGAGDNQLRTKIASNGSNTPAQQNTRSRFKKLAELFRSLGSTARAGLKRQGNQSAYNRFVGQNFYNTAADALNVASVDYSKLVISSGAVAPVTGLTAAVRGDGVLLVSYADNSNGNTALDTDRVKVILVNKQTGNAATPDDDEATRADGSVEINTEGQPAADLMVLAFAYRADGSDASPTTRLQVV
ncbi:DUF6266 family protein [Hymenobacter aerophilus]|uniref:DUF6266 family protein n=1 Tax=Hymenobacter aerophilus TaxID=119644 RepID=UPI0003688F94|nr:DUF6266 family protein [Hymenobacter aerophilus]